MRLQIRFGKDLKNVRQKKKILQNNQENPWTRMKIHMDDELNAEINSLNYEIEQITANKKLALKSLKKRHARMLKRDSGQI